MNETAKVTQHYGGHDLKTRIDDALSAAGLADGRLSPAVLAPLDQFHTRGLAATVELADAVGVPPGAQVIDIGSGLGGPSRYLVTTFDCRVRGVDLNPSFVAAARYLAERSGLSDKVRYDCANALALPYESESFDIAWTQHVAMNIADRARLYAEVRRVLRPGGRFAIYDIVAGLGGPLHFPVPWSREPETSFLQTSESMRAALEEAGFRVAVWTDDTEAGIGWLKARQAADAQSPEPPPVLGLHVAMGPDWTKMAANNGRNLLEGRTRLVRAVLERP